MMLRDDAEVALNDLIEACETAAQVYQTAAESAADNDLAVMFRHLAGERRTMLKDLAAHVRGMGELPQASDPDRTTARALIEKIKAVLSRNEHLTLLRECEGTDATLAHYMENALDGPLPEAARPLVRRQASEVTAAVGRLAAARARLQAESR